MPWNWPAGRQGGCQRFRRRRDGEGQGSASPADQVVQEIKNLGGEAVASYDSVATPEGARIFQDSAGYLRPGRHPHQQCRDPQGQGYSQNGTGKLEGRARCPSQRRLSCDPARFAAMREKGYGRIIMTTSAAGLYGNFGQTNYSAAKMGRGFMNTSNWKAASTTSSQYHRAHSGLPLTADILPPTCWIK